jgi:hypothetical protein
MPPLGKYPARETVPPSGWQRHDPTVKVVLNAAVSPTRLSAGNVLLGTPHYGAQSQILNSPGQQANIGSRDL